MKQHCSKIVLDSIEWGRNQMRAKREGHVQEEDDSDGISDSDTC